MSNYITPDYKMGRFIRGSYYSAETDYRRFVTMDYNMESYVGIVGVGIISGWTIEHVSGLNVQILPGKGIIDGFYSESPYVVKQRSDMVAGDREVEIIPDQNGIPEPPLTPAQRATYVSVVRLYDPTFNPVGSIENAYVKVVVPTVKTLLNNADNYLYASRPTGALPYPKMDDLSVMIAALGDPPVRSDYPNYTSYKSALDIYNAKLQLTHDYKWYDNPANHFTAVQFDLSTTPTPSSNQVLLGKVVTRSGNVTKIDISGVESLAGIESKIRAFAAKYVYAHHHGGTDPFDPPKVRLETDIRNTALLSYVPSSGIASYSVLERDYTGITLGHKHTYKIDTSGNGYTIDQLGSENSHVHKIVKFVVQTQQATLLPVDDHIHTVSTAEEKADTWDASSRFVVYLNGNQFADETSSYVQADPVTKKLTLNRGVSETFKTYRGDLTATIPVSSGTGFSTKDIKFTYTAKAEGVYRFMIDMQLKFYRQYMGALRYAYEIIRATYRGQSEAVEQAALDNVDPFLFSGASDLIPQSQSADALLKNEGDQFLFTPNAARNVTVTLVNKPTTYSDVVTIEFLSNTEVTGILRPENVMYIKAEKILTGNFDPDVIPFVSHVGRLQDAFSPFQYSLLSNDGVRYTVSPSVTGQKDDHYHRMQLDKKGNGKTTDTMIGGEVVYYAGSNSYFIAHTHNVQDFIVQDSIENVDLTAWQNDVHGTSETSSIHRHDTIYPSRGNNKIVYSVKQDSDGNIYAGTSDGLMMVPSTSAYVFVLNGYEFYMVGTDLWQLFNDAAAQYEALTEKTFVITQSVYEEEIIAAEATLTSVGDSTLIYGQNVPNVGQDVVMIKRIDSFKMPNFKYVAVKHPSDVLDTETVIRQITVRKSDGVEVDPSTIPANAASTVETMDVVERDLHVTPIWSMDFRRIAFAVEGSSSSSSSSSVLSTSSSSTLSINTSQSSSSSSSTSLGIITSSSSSSTSSASSSSSSHSQTSSSSSSVDSSSSESSSSQSITGPTDYVDIVVVGSDVIAKNRNLNQNTNKTWKFVATPFSVGVLRKIFKATNGDYWLSTNNGVMVSRSHNEGDIFTIATQPGADPDIQDVAEGDNDNIYCVSSSGVFKTVNEGKTWTKIFSVLQGFNQIVRDNSLDKSNTVSGHYHMASIDSEGNGILETSIGTGASHTHVVTEWSIATALSHTHNLVVTFYVVGNDKRMWKSTDSGITWSFYAYLPDGECGQIFAAFDKVFVSQGDGLYRYDASWTKVLDQKTFSYGWHYDMSGFFIGCNNAIYTTSDGNSFSATYSFDGLPALILTSNGDRKHFGYAYNSETMTFHFEDLFITSDVVVSLVDFNKWFDTQGGWSVQIPYQIYIDDKLILSTQYNNVTGTTIAQDYREDRQQYFNVYPETGLLDFTVSTELVNDINVYDLYVDVKDATGIYAGDTVLISNSASNSFFDTVAAVNDNEITLSSRSTLSIAAPATVSKIPSLTGDSDITANIFDSALSNAGILTHEQVEDGLSTFSDGRPYKFNDTYLSNLLQLTQAIRYVYPDINSEFVNDAFYDFRYNSDPVSPYYVGNFIDLLTSELYNKKVYDNAFVSKKSRSINKILMGYGRFANTIIVATDIGIFWAVKDPNYQSNWFYVNAVPFAIYDIILFKGEQLIAATVQGTYYTDDMKTWTLDTTSVMNYPSTAISLRWRQEPIVQIPIHDAYFSNFISPDPQVASVGVIEALSGVPYITLTVNSNLHIEGAAEKSGDYLIKSIEDGGSKMTVTPLFSGSADTKFGVTMKSGYWWQEWNTDVSTFNSELTNALLIGGIGHISYNNYEAVWKWYEASVEPDNYTVKGFLPLSSGNILAAATGNNVGASNYLLESNDVGRVWQTLKQFDPVTGTVSSIAMSDQSNSVLTVGYSTDYTYADGTFDQRDIILYQGATAIASGKVIGNKGNTITVHGDGFYNSTGFNMEGITFTVRPFKINAITETPDNAVWFGTDTGIYQDQSTITVQFIPEGTILGVGVDGTVNQIDISGSIISIGKNVLNDHSILRVRADTTIRENEVVGKSVYITDADPVEKYEIVSNTSTSVSDEVSIEIRGTVTDLYIGKKLKVVGDSSRLYVTFNLPALLNEFNGGTMYVTSNASVNYGKKYDIRESSPTFIDLETAIVPVSTLSGASLAVNSDVVQGQTIKAIASGNKLKLWTSMSRDFKDNEMVGLGFKVTTASSNAFSLSTLTIFSNTPNSITINENVNPLLFATGEAFEVHGILMSPLAGFNHRVTSTDSSHYHDLNLLNNTVSGTIQSFGTVNDSYVVINVADTVNFSDPIVQLREDLFEGGTIVFRNSNNYTAQYTAEIVSSNVSSITLYKGDANNWNFTGYDAAKTSVGWRWSIDGTSYGYTQGTTYDDFVVIGTKITSDANLEQYAVQVDSTAGMIVGDKIRIQDDSLSFEINYIASIVDASNLTVTTALSRTWFASNNPEIKVLRDVFSNTHMHQVRDNEIQLLSIQDYIDNGYPLNHSHRSLSLIPDVWTILDNQGMVASGSRGIIYGSNDAGNTWTEVVDLNQFLNGVEEVDGVSTIVVDNGSMIAGTTNGNIFVERGNGHSVVRIIEPEVIDSSSSSSSESSDSSSSESSSSLSSWSSGG